MGFPYWVKSFLDKQIIYDEKDEFQENDSEFLWRRTMQHMTQDRSFKAFSNKPIHLRPYRSNLFFFLFKDLPLPMVNSPLTVRVLVVDRLALT